jgi:hypothetical protein
MIDLVQSVCIAVVASVSIVNSWILLRMNRRQ